MSSVRNRPIWSRPLPQAIGVLLVLAAMTALPVPAAAEQTAWTAYAGRWGIGKNGETSELGFEIQRPLKYPGFDLIAGLAGTDDQAVWGYLGASYRWEPNGKWRLRPGFAVSFFDQGDGKDLGGVIEFRSSLEATYPVASKLRLGLMVYHLSNAGIYDLNPGANSLVFVIGFP